MSREEVSRLPTKSVSYRVGAAVVHAAVPIMMRLSVQGQQHVPATGPCIVVVNHVSHADPFPIAQVLTHAGRLPRFLAKDSLFDVPVVGPLLGRSGQIPVFRESSDAVNALDAADRALQRGECIVIYPEGTLTRDPELWPMRGKLGAARLALRHGCPVIPMATWGVQEWLPPYARWPRLFSRPPVQVLVGPPVSLEEYRTDDLAGVRELMRATQAIIVEITVLVARLRGLDPPASVWNPRAHGQTVTGNPLVVARRPRSGLRGRLDAMLRRWRR